MIKSASVGLGWWSNELADSIKDKNNKIKIVSCYSKNKKKELISRKNTKQISMNLITLWSKIVILMQLF